MSAHILITGALYREPEQRRSKGGKPFVTATIRDEGQFWNVLAFSESVQADLMQLAGGDALSVQGELRAELYRPENGEPRVNLTIIAESVLPLRLRARRRGPKAADAAARDTRSRQERCAGKWTPEQGLSDEIPLFNVASRVNAND
jgi:single-stranded DNA-binding protein